MTEAKIVLISKVDNGRLLVDFYQPISVLNTNLFAKVLAGRFAKVIIDLVYPDENSSLDFTPLWKNCFCCLERRGIQYISDIVERDNILYWPTLYSSYIFFLPNFFSYL